MSRPLKLCALLFRLRAEKLRTEKAASTVPSFMLVDDNTMNAAQSSADCGEKSIDFARELAKRKAAAMGRYRRDLAYLEACQEFSFEARPSLRI